MDYFPNVDAVTSFVSDVWPRIRERFAGITLTIVGANPVPAVAASRSVAGIEVTGTVPDVRPYYARALAAVVPLRTGGGTRLKILEAMAAGVPVISTPLGAEGLAVTEDRDILLAPADDAEAWIRHVEALRAGCGAGVVSAALNLVRARYDWNALGAKLVDAYRGWIA
jgi:glycosyltransferase involved in cell wall biosynthesis